MFLLSSDFEIFQLDITRLSFFASYRSVCGMSDPFIFI